ncbi:MAG: hypothetical protein IJ651_09320, partial [Bacteroidales bacterium]|nr:hypothetical protein [Bacteroidales bacterium]
REFTEHYKFTGEGTTLGYYDSRTFVIADMSKRLWRDQLLAWADRAMSYGADAVFYDQLGVAEEFPNWDLSREYPVQDIFTGAYKADALREIRDHIKARNPEFALGTEWLGDCTSQYCDFVHIVEFTALPESFPEWFRYTFPEVVWSDRCVRDDNDVPRRVNNTLLKGLRNDIEVFRCRGLIDETPVYQAHLARINALPAHLAGTAAGRPLHGDGRFHLLQSRLGGPQLHGRKQDGSCRHQHWRETAERDRPGSRLPLYRGPEPGFQRPAFRYGRFETE